MAQRRTTLSGNLESVINRLQELVLANSGEDEFDEIFKLLIAKLYSELHSDVSPLFLVADSPLETTNRINQILAIANSRWNDVLTTPKSNLTHEHLSVCVEALQDQKLYDSHLQILDTAFEFLMNKAAKGAKGQYFTPRHVIEACVRMIKPNPGENIIDPACGSAGFLIHALRYVSRNYPDVSSSEYGKSHLWGSDFDYRAIRIAKALMVIAGDNNTNLFRLNSLLTPELARSTMFSPVPLSEEYSSLTIEDVTRTHFRNFKGFDIVMSNPPFAGEVKEPHLLESFKLNIKGRRIDRDVLFLERCVNLLRPGGRMAIVLPHNKFAGESWGYVRQWLIKQVRVVAVLGLGRNMFLPHTHQKANILFAVKRLKPATTTLNEDILFLINEKEGKDSKGRFIDKSPFATTVSDTPWERVDHDLDELVQSFAEFVEQQSINWGSK